MKTRRKFLTDSWKWSGLIFVPRLLRAQPVFPPAFWAPAAAAAGGGGETTWATGISFASGFKQDTGSVGIGNGLKITVGASPITITQLGAWAFADGFETTVTVKIYDASCVFITGAVATPNIGANDGAMHFAVVTTPPTLSASTVYLISCTAYYYWTNAGYTTTGAATCNDATFDACGLQGLGTNHGAGPLNFKYTT